MIIEGRDTTFTGWESVSQPMGYGPSMHDIRHLKTDDNSF